MNIKKVISYFFEVIIIVLMIKFIPFRGRDLPEWSQFLISLPIIVLVLFVVKAIRKSIWGDN